MKGMIPDWVIGGAAGVALFVVLNRLANRLVRGLARRRESDYPAESVSAEASELALDDPGRFRADLLSYGWPVVLGLSMVGWWIGGGVAFGWALFGVALSIFAALSLAARIRYGTGKLRDLSALVGDLVRMQRI
jgi:hypothetical protein